jgi:hypothetical protein
MLPARSFLTAIKIIRAKVRNEKDRPAGKIPLGRQRSRLVNNIKLYQDFSCEVSALLAYNRN